MIHQSVAIDEMLKLCTGHIIIFCLAGWKCRWLFKSLTFLHQGKGETTSLKLFSQLCLLLPFSFFYFVFKFLGYVTISRVLSSFRDEA